MNLIKSQSAYYRRLISLKVFCLTFLNNYLILISNLIFVFEINF